MNHELIQALAIGSLVLLCVVSTIASWIDWRFYKHLERKHPNLWRHAGSPKVLTHSSLYRGWPMLLYMQKRKYEICRDDIPGRELCEKFRLPVIFSYWAIVLAGLLAFTLVGMHVF